MQITIVGVSDGQPPGTKEAPCTTYFVGRKELSEQEMLKIVKLKVFL